MIFLFYIQIVFLYNYQFFSEEKMKKVLTTALILGALYGTANAAEITSPIYMPKKGEIINALSLGQYNAAYDKEDMFDLRLIEKGLNILDSGKIGLRDNLSLNYGFEFDFNRKVNKAGNVVKISEEFYDRYFGLTARAYDNEANKLDIILNFGQIDTPYVDLSARYGLDLNNYNLAFSFGGIYHSADEEGNSREQEKMQYYFELDNELAFADSFTFDLNFKYLKDRGEKFRNAPITGKSKGSDNYTIYTALNYSINKANYLGIYFENTWSHGQKEYIEDKTNYNYGIKLTSQF